MPKKKISTKESFESRSGSSNFVALYFDMMDSKAWNELTPHAKDLYLRMRRKYTRKVTNGQIWDSNKDNISMPVTEYTEFMHQKTFYKAIDSLIEKGFIKMVRSGKFTMQCNIFGFTDKWQEYGEPGYNIPKNWKRPPQTK